MSRFDPVERVRQETRTGVIKGGGVRTGGGVSSEPFKRSGKFWMNPWKRKSFDRTKQCVISISKEGPVNKERGWVISPRISFPDGEYVGKTLEVVSEPNNNNLLTSSIRSLLKYKCLPCKDSYSRISVLT